MRKTLIITLITLAIFSLAVTNAISSETSESENLTKAKSEALEKRETTLQQEVEDINKLMKEISEDGIAAGLEMRTLVQSMEKFQKDKKKFDKELKVYNTTTETDLGENFHKALQSYSTQHPTNCRDSKGEMKLLFAEECGKDVRIDPAPRRILLLVLSILFIMIGVALIPFLGKVTNGKDFTIILLIALGLIALGMFFICL